MINRHYHEVTKGRIVPYQPSSAMRRNSALRVAEERMIAETLHLPCEHAASISFVFIQPRFNHVPMSFVETLRGVKIQRTQWLLAVQIIVEEDDTGFHERNHIGIFSDADDQNLLSGIPFLIRMLVDIQKITTLNIGSLGSRHSSILSRATSRDTPHPRHPCVKALP